jgi:hypothetical protein
MTACLTKYQGTEGAKKRPQAPRGQIKRREEEKAEKLWNVLG